ncbi:MULTISPECIES: LicD family protein [Providencia]|uniref:LicD family protein n=1 Tax=Providencia TaxID=586 RepID=UPI000CFFA313|nr:MULTISPECIES: LicD family protein [Providencia]AVL73312.1 LicD family protein [Providencia rettgeri]EKH6495461.1 LicD family protein [Providencia rettgeri]ELR5052730.1 LicD family protein [Providencia rettgeri]ELR5154078.1 LicD family protein [Providencia rettgeri]ELR5180646.1 LicD family protein [Providencia rettgeri]
MNRYKKINTSELQSILLEGLLEIHRVCEKHDLSYWLDSGTLLGAIRNGTFIPWDDDIDICMPREDFNRFISCSYDELDSNKYFLQTPKTDKFYKDFDIPCKLKINNTLLIESNKTSTLSKKPHQGFFIDIFPCDQYPTDKLTRKMYQSIYFLYHGKSLFYRKNISKKALIASHLIHYTIPIKLLNWLTSKVCNRLNKNKNNTIISKGVELPFHKGNIPKDNIFPLSKIYLSGYAFYSPNNSHEYLKSLYGINYMTPPPLDQQISHSSEFYIDIHNK